MGTNKRGGDEMFQMISLCPISEEGSIGNCMFDDDPPTLREFCWEIANGRGKYGEWGFIDVRFESSPVRPMRSISYNASSSEGFTLQDDYVMDYRISVANFSGNKHRMDYIVILEGV